MSASQGGRGPSTPRPDLSERNRRILASLVREYIEHGEPVSSLWLAEHSGLDVSSATVRNVLGALEELGYLRQPHTSAGRVPTDLAYRCYVDQILEARRSHRLPPAVEARLRQAASLEQVFDTVSQELSRSSHHLGFALVLASEATILKHLELVALDPTRVLVVIVAAGGQVSHKPVTVAEPLKPSDLTQAANYLNREFAGRPLGEIRDALAARMLQDRVQYDGVLARVLTLASTSLAEAAAQGPLFVHGTSSLIDPGHEDDGDPSSMSRLRSLLAMIEEKHRLIELLTGYIEGPGLTVVIGGEHLSPELKGYSLVATSHEGDGQAAAVGVIGPTRMRYPRAITAVESLAQILGRVLADPGHPGT
jgi:heat-inducible transcriptional repressor